MQFVKRVLLVGIVLIILLIILYMSGFPEKKRKPKERTQQQNITLQVAAASSLQNALEDIQTQYTKTHPNVSFSFTYDSSSTIQNQIQQGAPVDIFLSSSKSHMQTLIDQGLISEDHSVDLLKNRLVLAVPKDNPAGIETIEDLKKRTVSTILIGNPDVEPVGVYAKETLESLHLWNEAEKKIVYASTLAELASNVEQGAVDTALLYKTQATDAMTVVSAIPDHAHTPIIYPAGVVNTTKHLQEAERFIQYLQTKEAAAVFERYGFEALHSKQQYSK
jgi:molybdate transport system substrate-binding protein